MDKKRFKNLSFKHTWRPYQAKVLHHFSEHISDNHFHIVAPPGSGKTILGLEIVRKIGKKTLILSPTNTIKNQWNERLQVFFTKQEFKHISFDIKKPSDITFSTYQGLQSFFKRFSNKNDYFLFFKQQNIEVILLDEAHHLKNEWWKCLFALKEHHINTVIALTATPPYDSSNAELQKYFKLCGKIDDEISIPELIKEKNICPHQDLVYLSLPEKNEIEAISDFRLKIMNFYDEILNDVDFISFLKTHRYYAKTENHLDEIYTFSNFFSSILIFLNEAKQPIANEKLMLLGFDKNEEIIFPKLNNNWLQILFQHILITDRNQQTESENYLNSLEKRLQKLAVFRNKKIDFIGNEHLYKSLSKSSNKLKSIEKIITEEQRNLGSELRCVILADYIKKEYLTVENSNTSNINDIGVVPIFQRIKSKTVNRSSLAILTGSLVVVHTSIIAKIELIDNLDNYTFTGLQTDSEFVNISFKGSHKNNLVGTITNLFEAGHIKILIGTKSLLGEGWDAPSINSLILASFVGSFVSSNQMRGRAIRINPTNPTKVGIIWHLASIDISDENNGADFDVLSKRFNAFLGISNHKKPTITNGIERLGLPSKIDKNDIEKINENNISIAQNRNKITSAWKYAIENGKELAKKIVRYHVNDTQFIKQKKVYVFDIVKYSITEIVIGLSFFIPEFILKNIPSLMGKGMLYFLYTLSAGLFLTFGGKIYHTIQLYLKYGLIYKKIDAIAKAILATMQDLKMLSTDINTINIHTELLEKGDVSCTIYNATQLESTLFSDALNELLLPITNPKYLLVRTSKLKRHFNIENFYAVPKLFDDNKKIAETFLKHWNKKVKKSTLIYTRNFKGRKLLIKARLLHIHHLDKNLVRKNIIWK